MVELSRDFAGAGDEEHRQAARTRADRASLAWSPTKRQIIVQRAVDAVGMSTGDLQDEMATLEGQRGLFFAQDWAPDWCVSRAPTTWHSRDLNHFVIRGCEGQQTRRRRAAFFSV